MAENQNTGTRNQSGNATQSNSENIVSRIREQIRGLDKDTLKRVVQEVWSEAKNKGLNPSEFDIR